VTEVDDGARTPSVDHVLTDGEMPSLYISADGDATSAQRQFVRLQVAEILLPLAGVALGVVLPHYESSWQWLGLAASALVAAAAILRVYERTTQIEAVWYRSRSCAETIKSLAWRYAVGVSPFPLELKPDVVSASFIEHLRHAAESYPNLSPPVEGEEISAGMRDLRGQPLATRIDAYTRGRLLDQERWYARKALKAATGAQRWDSAFYALVGLAVVAGVVLVTHENASIIVAIGGAGAGAVLTWSSVRRMSSNAHMYRQVATDLSFFRSLVPGADKPDEWDHFVTSVEQRIAVENQRWQAARL